MRTERGHVSNGFLQQARADQIVGGRADAGRRDGNFVRNGIADFVLLRFVIAEEEQAIADDAAADAGAILLEREWRFGGEEIVGVPGIGAAVGVCGSMESIAAGLNADVDDGARLPAIFGARILIGLEFVDGVDGQHRSGIARGHDGVHDALRHPGVVAVDAIHHEEIVVRAETVGALRPAGVAGVFGHAGAQVEQVFKVAPVERQIVDHLVGERAPKFRTGGVECRRFIGHRDGLRLIARLQREIGSEILPYFQNNVL